MLLSPFGTNKLIVYNLLINLIKYLGFKKLSSSLIRAFELNGLHFVKTSIETPLGIKYLYLTNSIDDLRYACRSSFIEWESVSRSFFSSIAIDCEFVLDIGAYTGVYSIETALNNNDCRINAFEPNPIIFSNLHNNIRINKLLDRVSLFQIALGRNDGISKLYVPELSKWNSMSSLISTSNRYFEVTVSTIDHMFNSHRVDLIKIDVEGYESEVFLGGQFVLDEFKPIILAEALTYRELRNQKQILSKYGYIDPIQVYSGSKSDRRNYVWFSVKDKQKVNFNLNKSRIEFIKSANKNSQKHNNF